MLSEKDKEKIKKILKRQNKFIWRDDIVEKVIQIIIQIREGHLKQDDFFVEGLLTYEDWSYQIQLNQFI